MIAHQATLNSFLTKNKTQFVIPVYQRNYDWTDIQCKQLFQDIIAVGHHEDETHFIGSIVLIQEGIYTSVEVNPLIIIDGQQRLTTITLLYLALYKYALNNEMEEKAEEIHDTILINRYVKDKGSKLKLKQTDNNSKAFDFILHHEDKEVENYEEYSRLIENYTLFKNKITSSNFEALNTGLEKLLFVEISLELGKDDPQRIFESLNSTGLDLSQADLIRNYILMGLPYEKQVHVFKTYWDPIEKYTKDEQSNTRKVSDFIRDYLTIVNKKIPNKGKVYEEFKKRFPEPNQDFYTNTLTSVKKYAKVYDKLINPRKESEKDIREELKSIKMHEINVSYPFLMPVYSDYNEKIIDKETFINILKLVQSYTWRRFIVGVPTNALNKIFMGLYMDVYKNDYLASIERSLVRKKGSQRFPTNKEVIHALKEKDIYNTQSKNKYYFFKKLEHYNNREQVNIYDDEITVEHIFPQKPDTMWKSNLSEESYQLLSNNYLHTIGNLTLSGNNGALGNKVFLEKKIMNRDDGEQGYNFSSLWLNRYLKEIEEWNIDTFNARVDLITKRFLDIWEYPSVIDIENEEHLYTIFNAPSPRNKHLKYFNFKNELIEVREVSKMYYHIIRVLFEEQPELMLQKFIAESIGLTKTGNVLRMPYAINDNYFIEANLSNNSKFNKLKTLLVAFRMEEELLFAYED